MRVLSVVYKDHDEAQVKLSKEFEESNALLRLDVLKDVIGVLTEKYNAAMDDFRVEAKAIRAKAVAEGRMSAEQVAALEAEEAEHETNSKLVEAAAAAAAEAAAAQAVAAIESAKHQTTQ
jgi:hypothetical protein